MSETMSSTTTTSSNNQSITADRTDMIAYMKQANQLNRWERPSIRSHSIPECVASVVKTQCETTLAYQLAFEKGSISVYRIEDTNYVLHVRDEDERDQTLFSMPYWGEACMDIRYWLLQGKINDRDFEITHISDSAMECMLSASPPEWEDKICELVEKHHNTTDK
jgi:hypothetical protein